MNTSSNAATATPANATGLAAWMKSHPLVAFFIMAYGFAWLLWIPFLVLSQDGIGLLPFKAPALLLGIIGGFCPAIAAIIITGLLEGRSGIGRLLRRLIQWRVGLPWYLLAIFGIPVAFLLLSVALGYIPSSAALSKWSMLLTFYPLALIAQVLVAGGLGEEPGWRGFALPRMQSKFGPLPASVLLGILHACWHIPLFFVPELSQSHASFILFVIAGVAISIMLTWVYNRSGGSLLIIMLLHEAEDTTSNLSLRIAPQFLDRFPVYVILFGIIAIAGLIITRGRLGYKGTEEKAVTSSAPANA